MYMEQKLRLILYYAKIPNLQMPVIKAFLIHFLQWHHVGLLFHEKSFIGIIEQVIKDVLACHCLIWQLRTLVYMRIHSAWSAINNNIVLLNYVRGDL